MRNNDIDGILGRAAQSPEHVDPALLDRVTAAIGASLAPVRPISVRAMFFVLVLLATATGAVTAAVLGIHGWERLSATQAAVIFSALALLLYAVAAVCVGQIVPGSPRPVAPAMLLAAGALALAAMFAILFHDYGTARFVELGYPCLQAGLAVALPTCLVVWLLLRWGFAVNPVSAGVAAGTLAGIAGLTMLEMHCAYFSAFHVMVWHVGVIPITAAVGALLGWAVERYRRLR